MAHTMLGQRSPPGMEAQTALSGLQLRVPATPMD